MLFGPLVRALLWLALVFIVLTVLVVLAIDLHAVDWLFDTGTGTYDALHSLAAYLQHTYYVNRLNIDLGIKIIGLASTIILGGVLPTLYWWRHGEENLPLRLQKYADHLRDGRLSDRAILIAPLSPLNLKGLLPLPDQMGALSHGLRWIGMTPAQRASRRVKIDTTGLNGDVIVFASKLDLCRIQRNTIHLLAGLELAAQARELNDGSTEQSTVYEAALKEFRSALTLKPDDIDALEQASKTAKLLNQSQQVQVDLADLERAALKQKRPTRYARALRFQAELLEERGNRNALKDARLKLETAAEALENEDGGDERLLELAMIQEQLAGVHLKRGTPTLAEDCLDDAEELYGKLKTPDGPAGATRVAHIRKQLSTALREGDEPDEQDDATAPANGMPTHVTSATTPVYRERGGTADPTLTLAPFTAVVILTDDSRWPLVAKDGKALGHVAATDLHLLS